MYMSSSELSSIIDWYEGSIFVYGYKLVQYLFPENETYNLALVPWQRS